VSSNKHSGSNEPSPESSEAAASPGSAQLQETVEQTSKEVPVEQLATRAAKTLDGMSKGKLVLLGGGLLVAVLFFVLTATVSKSPKKPTTGNPHSEQARQEEPKESKGSVTPLMDTQRQSVPDDTSGQLGPGDIRRTRSLDQDRGGKPPAAKPAVASSLGMVPSFADTQQRWEDPAPYGVSPPAADISQTQQSSLKEPSLVFVRSVLQSPAAAAPRVDAANDWTPRLELPPGARIQAKLETQISSAVLAPVVAVVEYTYAIGDRIVVPSGARVYGQLQQADQSGLVSVKFDEIELLDGVREKINAVGAGLDFGPIKGYVYGKNAGKNFLVRAVSGLGSVLAEVAGNNSGAAFSEDDMLRERLAENIGTAGDSEVMSLNASRRLVVSVPADTKIYVVFINREQAPAALHTATPRTQ
jgi:type IV secretory pathway VirB10-like protein